MAMAGAEHWIAPGSSEIILRVFVFSLAFPTVLLNYSAGISTVRFAPLRAAGWKIRFHYEALGAHVAF